MKGRFAWYAVAALLFVALGHSAFAQTGQTLQSDTSTNSAGSVTPNDTTTPPSSTENPYATRTIQGDNTSASAPETTTTSSQTTTQPATDAGGTAPSPRPNQPSAETNAGTVSPNEAPSSTPPPDRLQTIDSNQPPQYIQDTLNANLHVQQEATAVSEKLTNSITTDLNKQVPSLSPQPPSPHTPRERIPRTPLQQKIQTRTNELSSQVKQVLTSTTNQQEIVTGLDTAYKSSRKDIETIVLEETGKQVSLSSPSTRISPEVMIYAQEFTKNTAEARESGGLALYRDSDRDGVSDFDEEHVFGTDPHNPRTSGSPLTDGERILRGLDVHGTIEAVVPVESPLVAGPVTPDIFTVESITAVPTLNEATTTPQKKVTFRGTAPPNSFVTIYIYSNPIVVTVKTNSEGRWQYTLDKPLEDGSHEMHVAMVDNEGKILAKSAAIPFTQTAEAIEYTPTLTPFAGPDPVAQARTNLIVLGTLALLVLILFIIVLLGLAKRSAETLPPEVPPQAPAA